MAKLTVKALENAKPKAKAYKLFDEAQRDGEGGHLYAYVLPSGRIKWRARWRDVRGGKVKETSKGIGEYPAMSLAEARRERSRVDAPQEKGLATFGEVARQFIKHQAPRRREEYGEYVEDKLKDLAPIFDRHIEAIRGEELRPLIEAVDARTGTMANRLCSLASQVFEYAQARELCDRNPAAKLAKLFPERKGAGMRAIPVGELPGLLRAIDAYQGDAITKAGLKLAYLTALRSGELCASRWEWLGELEGVPCLIVPAEKMKARKRLAVPLSAQALAEVEALRPRTGNTPFILAAPFNPCAQISTNALLFALSKRMGFDMTTHGIRSHFKTICMENGRERWLVEMSLAHVLPPVERAYWRGDCIADRLALMQWFADHLDKLRG